MDKNNKACCETSPQKESDPPGSPAAPLEMLPIYHEHTAKRAPECEDDSDAPCCGPPAGPVAGIHEKPGYTICHFVNDFIGTPAGSIPRIKTGLSGRDHLGTIRVRLGMGRNNYTVSPGLYAVGQPGPHEPVLVTANYKLSFDHLRRHLGVVSVWILVLDTRGINVWCAAGKGTFGTREIVRRVQATGLSRVVSHGTLILPQLGAPGVSAREVKKGCGFRVIWGPVRARDLPAFLAADQTADISMRRVTFSLAERMVLVPVELWLIRKAFLWALPAIFLLSGLGDSFFSITAAWQRGLLAAAACLTGILSGTAIVPALLPWIPGRAFALKGMLAGMIMGIAVILSLRANDFIALWPAAGLVLLTMGVSSYLAMNFTGTTPFTSPSGVEKEMRRFIPIQLLVLVMAAGLWVGSAF